MSAKTTMTSDEFIRMIKAVDNIINPKKITMTSDEFIQNITIVGTIMKDIYFKKAQTHPIYINEHEYTPMKTVEHEKYNLVYYEPKSAVTHFMIFTPPLCCSFKCVDTDDIINEIQQIDKQIIEICHNNQTVFVLFYGGTFLNLKRFNTKGDMIIKEVVQAFWKDPIDKPFQYKLVLDMDYISTSSRFGITKFSGTQPTLIEFLRMPPSSRNDKTYNNVRQFVQFLNTSLYEINQTRKTLNLEGFNACRKYHLTFSRWYDQQSDNEKKLIIKYYKHKLELDANHVKPTSGFDIARYSRPRPTMSDYATLPSFGANDKAQKYIKQFLHFFNKAL